MPSATVIVLPAWVVFGAVMVITLLLRAVNPPVTFVPVIAVALVLADPRRWLQVGDGERWRRHLAVDRDRAQRGGEVHLVRPRCRRGVDGDAVAVVVQ